MIMRDNKKMILFMKKNIVKILIALGVISAGMFAVYTQKNNIPTQNTWEGFIGVALFNVPILTGTWIASERMKERRSTLSKF